MSLVSSGNNFTVFTPLLQKWTGLRAYCAAGKTGRGVPVKYAFVLFYE